jgi:hypothetical protein
MKTGVTAPADVAAKAVMPTYSAGIKMESRLRSDMLPLPTTPRKARLSLHRPPQGANQVKILSEKTLSGEFRVASSLRPNAFRVN